MVPRPTRGYPCTRVTRGITRGWRVPVPEYLLGTGDGLRKNNGYPYPRVFTRVAPYDRRLNIILSLEEGYITATGQPIGFNLLRINCDVTKEVITVDNS